jgi:hypothetical protein
VLFPAVDTSTATVGTLGVQALGALEQTRTDLRQHLDTQLTMGIGPALEKSAAFTGLQQQVAAKVDTATLNQKLKDASDFTTFQKSLTSVLTVVLEQPHPFIDIEGG